MKPPIQYFGGKTLLANRIVATLPPHRHYVEPYAGSLAVLLAKSPSRMETINDLDRSLRCWHKPETRGCKTCGNYEAGDDGCGLPDCWAWGCASPESCGADVDITTGLVTGCSKWAPAGSPGGQS